MRTAAVVLWLTIHPRSVAATVLFAAPTSRTGAGALDTKRLLVPSQAPISFSAEPVGLIVIGTRPEAPAVVFGHSAKPRSIGLRVVPAFPASTSSSTSAEDAT